VEKVRLEIGTRREKEKKWKFGAVNKVAMVDKSRNATLARGRTRRKGGGSIERKQKG